MKRGFTLIEIMIVIAIIAILMTVTMQFWSKRIDDLGNQAGKEQFITAYEKLYSQATTSNYHEGVRYDMLHIALRSGANPLSYAYDSEMYQSVNISTPLAISWLQTDTNIVDEVNLDIQPYTLWCGITSSSNDEIFTWSIVSFNLVVKWQKQYCFTIKNDTCKLIEIKCWT
jgi:prepilin-type N-terminal cleavage/methylation domain-containing protein